MPSMRIFLATSPFVQTYSFKPGEKINIQVKFDTDNFPDRYRLQIVDHKNNSRLNRYGGRRPEINIENWPIPANIKEEHLGIWFVKLDDISSRLGENDNILSIMKQIFFIEKDLEVLKPEKIDIDVITEEEISVVTESVSEEIISEQILVESSEGQDLALIKGKDLSAVYHPVTDVRGIGKTYAERLNKINVQSVSDFWYYQDRIAMAEIMRVNDKRLEKMLEDAEIILSKEADKKVSLELVETGEVVPDDLKSVKGVDDNIIKKLESLGIRNKSDLLNYEDISILRKTMSTSSEKFRSILASVGRIIEPDDVRKPIPIEVPNQPVITVKGIGRVTAQKLNSVKVFTVQDLLESNFEKVKTVATKKQYNKWMVNASILLKKPLKIEPKDELKESPVNDLLSLPGIGPKTLEKLNALNINTRENLLEFKNQLELRKILRMSETRFNSFIKSLEKSK